MKTSKIAIILLIIFFGVLTFDGINAIADNTEMSPLEYQQFKILKLSKVTQKNPSDDSLKANIETYKKGLEYYKRKDYLNAILELSKIDYSTLILPLYTKSQYILAESYKNRDEWDKAIEVYQNFIPRDFLFPDFSYFLLARTYQLKGNFQLSINVLENIIDDFPNSSIISQTYYQIAQNYLQLNESETAIIYFKKGLKETKDTYFKATILLQLSEILWQKNKCLESIDYLYQILHKGYQLKRNSESEELLVRRFYLMTNENKKNMIPCSIRLKVGDILFKYRQYAQAEEIYGTTIECYPEAENIEEVYYKRARTLFYMKEYQKVIDHCKAIIDRFSPDEIVIKTEYLFSNTLYSLGEFQNAIKKFQKIINQYPQSYYARESYLRLAECFFRLDEEPKAILMWQELSKEYPNSYEAMISLWKYARYFNNKKDYFTAISAYKILIESFSKSSRGDDAHYWMGKSLKQLGNEKEADMFFKELVLKYPLSYYTEKILERSEKFKEYSPVTNFSERKFKKIEAFLNEYSTTNEKSEFLLLRAEIFKEINFFEQAIIMAKEALSHDPGNLSILFELSDIYKKNKDFYRSLNYTEIIFNYLQKNREWEEMPIELWKNLYPDYYSNFIEMFLKKYEVDPLFVLATIREESRFNPESESAAGARGLMQIIYSTGEWIAEKIDLNDFNDELLFSPEVNINLGCWYIQYLNEKFSSDLILMISGYNAGPGITSQWLKKYDFSDEDNFIENIPYEETREHIKKVLKSYLMYKRIASLL